MKILLTGCTKLQISRPEDRRSSGMVKIDVPAAVEASLVRMGHDVDWRAVTIGEDLSAYDFMWCCTACPQSTNGAAGTLGAFWALSHAELPSALFMDDWRATRVGHSQMRSLMRDPAKYFFRCTLREKREREMCGNLESPTYSYRNAFADATEALERQRERLLEAGEEKAANSLWVYKVYPDDHAVIADHIDALEVGLHRMYDGVDRTIRAVPMYTWGDVESVRAYIAPETKGEPIYKLDPSHVVEVVAECSSLPSADERALAWALPLITPPAEFIERHAASATWPIDTVGHRTSSVKRLPTEVDVLEWISRRSGVFAPPYFGGSKKTKPLTGWWRSRYLYAAIAKVPLVAFKGEADALGRPYKVTIRDVERMTRGERVELALDQSNALRPHYANRDRFDEMVDGIIAAAIG